jgi:hypothetical protein
MTKFQLLLPLTLLGCLHRPLLNPGDSFLDNFESSNSPCVDAAAVNMAAAKCQNIYQTIFPNGYVSLKCENYPSDSTSSWATNIFIVIPIDMDIPPTLEVICADPLTFLTVFYRPNQAPIMNNDGTHDIENFKENEND